MSDILLLLLGISFIISSVAYLALSKRQRDLILSRFHFRGRRASTSNTPPRSLSPVRKLPNNVPPAIDYKDTFPPSGREALVKVAGSLPLHRQLKVGRVQINEDEFRKSLIPLTAHYETCGSSAYTPTGFSIGEVKALGDFPDYAELSGVPLPEPYHECDFEKALPRPYRPFRWSYHQTMCSYLPITRSLRDVLLTKHQPLRRWKQIGGSNSREITPPVLGNARISSMHMDGLCSITSLAPS